MPQTVVLLTPSLPHCAYPSQPAHAQAGACAVSYAHAFATVTARLPKMLRSTSSAALGTPRVPKVLSTNPVDYELLEEIGQGVSAKVSRPSHCHRVACRDR